MPRQASAEKDNPVRRIHRDYDGKIGHNGTKARWRNHMRQKSNGSSVPTMGEGFGGFELRWCLCLCLCLGLGESRRGEG